MGRFLIILWALIPFGSCRGEITVDAAFDNGRIEVVSIDQANRVVTTRVPADGHAQDARMRFWHMRISGLTPGELVTVRHTPDVASVHYVYSYDGEQWFRFPEPGIAEQRMRFVRSSVHIAPNIPYPYSRSLALAAEMAASPHVTVSDLATSEEGRAVKMLRITDAATPDTGKRIVWLMGRQHAFESASSYVPEGFARWMASDDPAAAAFRRQVIAHVVPVMDVDNVAKGMTGKDMPNDWNRVWNQQEPAWAAVRAAKVLLDGLHRNHSFLAFIDAHNPFYDQTPHWHVTGARDNWDRFATAYRTAVGEAGRANWDATVIESEVGFDPVDLSVAKNHAIKHWNNAPDFLALTMESAHHRDSEGRLMTKEGYLQWGEAIGRGLYKHTGGELTPAYAPPRARFTADGAGSFDGGASVAPGRQITAYHWDFGDGTVRTTGAAVTRHEHARTGHYPVTLRVECGQGLLSPPFPVTVAGGPVPAGPVSSWTASRQLAGTNWLNSGWSGSFRILVRGDMIERQGDRLALVVRGRSSGSYTLRRASIAKRSGTGLDVIPGSSREITFGGTWNDGVNLPASSTRTSDPIDFPLRPGEDAFVTFHLEGSGAYLNTTGTSTAAWFHTTADHSATLNWSGISGLENRAYIYAASEILVLPAIQERYDSWRGGIDWKGADDGPSADPRGNGVPNLVSYALGFHPLQPVPDGALPSAHAPVQPADGMMFRFRRHGRRPDVSYEVEASGDLRVWETIARSSGGGPTTATGAAVIGETSGADGLLDVVVRDQDGRDAKGRFLRLRLLLPPP